MSDWKHDATIHAEGQSSKYFLDFLVPLTVLLALTLVFRVTGLDLKLSALFYAPEGGWIYSSAPICTFLYDYGTWPGIFLAIAAAIMLVAGLLRQHLSPYRKPALFFILLLALGPGLIVNGILKNNSERPRPRDVTAFSGSNQFHKVLDFGEPGQGQGFPSGHASVGFFLGAPYFVLRKSNRRWALFWLLLGLTYGGAIGLVRMAQGGHFASDILWAWGIVHLCGVALAHLLHLGKQQTGKLLLPE
ncbi:MAG: phosphatase PAP2 family protein [Syntrophobacteraceae bacterium]